VERRPATALDLLDFLSLMMDRCFEAPGGKRRFGLSSLLPFVPVLGDVVTGMVSFLILTVGLSHYQIPRIVAARMTINSLLRSTMSAIPFIGNLFNLYFQADTRNVALIRQYAGQEGPPPSTWRHWVFVLGMLLGCLVLLALVVLGLTAAIVGLARLMQAPPA
jgi:hypothetical protein